MRSPTFCSSMLVARSAWLTMPCSCFASPRPSLIASSWVSWFERISPLTSRPQRLACGYDVHVRHALSRSLEWRLPGQVWPRNQKSEPGRAVRRAAVRSLDAHSKRAFAIYSGRQVSGLNRTRRRKHPAVPSAARVLASVTPLHRAVFGEAAEGIRTLDLLHGKQSAADGHGPQCACKRAVSSGSPTSPGVRDFTPICGVLRAE
jgi:hypothetical protein